MTIILLLGLWLILARVSQTVAVVTTIVVRRSLVCCRAVVRPFVGMTLLGHPYYWWSLGCCNDDPG